MVSDFKDLISLRDRLMNAKRTIRRAVMSEMDRTADDVKERMRQLAPVDTGNLRDSIAVTKLGDQYRIGPVNVPYAAAQEYGARPHTIKAAPGKFLVFQVGGKTIFAKTVKHPGNKAQPYVRPTRAWAEEVFKDRVRVVGTDLLKSRN